MLFTLTLVLASIGQVDRSEFSMLGASTPITPKPNRIETIATLKPLIILKANELSARYISNEDELRKRMTRNRLIDYMYTLPNFHGPLTDAEDDEIDKIVKAACNPPKIRKALLSGFVNGKKMEIFGWDDPKNPSVVLYNLSEQSEEFKKVYNESNSR